MDNWNAGKIKMLLAHPDSTAYGLNLQAGGHIVVWYGLTWSLELYQQANARLHRQGQQKPVIIHHLVAKGTMDERVMKALSNKAAGQDALLEAVKAEIKTVMGGNQNET
jgi:SNF2 family DNA or RNA helicase